ncbi:hypothetical protein ACIQC9_05750 [Brevundimonas sp. NPDC092305]|uniref:hypothetical protein n=1 Tax=Brevundimonas sp. NPDC092305 TaxID=3363957 RepID=UPI00380D102C
MARRSSATASSVEPVPATPDLSTYPVREYVAAMSAELAGMAREEGDPLLAQALDLASQMARRPA